MKNIKKNNHRKGTKFFWLLMLVFILVMAGYAVYLVKSGEFHITRETSADIPTETTVTTEAPTEPPTEAPTATASTPVPDNPYELQDNQVCLGGGADVRVDPSYYDGDTVRTDNIKFHIPYGTYVKEDTSVGDRVDPFGSWVYVSCGDGEGWIPKMALKGYNEDLKKAEKAVQEAVDGKKKAIKKLDEYSV